MKPTNKVTPDSSGSHSKHTHLLYNPTFRSVVFQLLAVCVLAFFLYTIVNNALTNRSGPQFSDMTLSGRSVLIVPNNTGTDYD
ncbi:amino acid ABC transporter, permease protein [Vibrio cholerae]|nr:amino acid ABC transporter, permease protein [Vibrio cholerae]